MLRLPVKLFTTVAVVVTIALAVACGGNKPAEVLFTRDDRGWAEAPAPKN